MRGRVAFIAVVLLGACWADFPDSRYQADGFAGASDTGPGRDGTVAGGDVRGSDGPSSCQAGAFVGCQGSAVVRCNAAGTGTVTVACGNVPCDAAKQRCDQCDPAAPPRCDQGDAVTCSIDGLEEVTTCPAGCGQGVCCTDADGDGACSSDDCNDQDDRVKPGQNSFFDEASAGSFDYNCDGQQELQYPDPVNCQGTNSNDCGGDGWENAVPACGEEAQFVRCRWRQGSCREREPESRKQPCR